MIGFSRDSDSISNLQLQRAACPWPAPVGSDWRAAVSNRSCFARLYRCSDQQSSTQRTRWLRGSATPASITSEPGGPCQRHDLLVRSDRSDHRGNAPVERNDASSDHSLDQTTLDFILLLGANRMAEIRRGEALTQSRSLDLTRSRRQASDRGKSPDPRQHMTGKGFLLVQHRMNACNLLPSLFARDSQTGSKRHRPGDPLEITSLVFHGPGNEQA